MPSIATCPECAAQFTLPEFAAEDDRAQCPECRAEFSVAQADRRELPVALILPPVEELETPIEPEAELELEAPAPFAEFSPELRAAETVAFPSTTLAGWEERLKRAMETTGVESSNDSPVTPLSSQATVLETAPEFDFHMDPPEENPLESDSAPTENLPDPQTWFEDENPATDDKVAGAAHWEGEAGLPAPQTEPAEASVAESDAPGSAGASPSRRPRRRSAFMKRTAFAAVFGLCAAALGQYALLWLRGPSADYMQLAQVLPASLLPASTSPASSPPIAKREETPVADAPREQPPVEALTQEVAENETPKVPPATQVKAPPVKRDDAVQPATAEVAPPQLLPTTNTTFAQFSELLASAQAAAPTLEGGDLKTQESARVKGHAYMALCNLAEQFDFVNDLGLGPDAERQAAQARAFFRTTAAAVAAQNDFKLIVARWWEHNERPTPGIFLVGRVEEVQSADDHTLYQVAVALPDETTLIPVLADEASFKTGDQIGVVGTIVASPQKVLPKFSLDLPQLAVAQDTFVVPGG